MSQLNESYPLQGLWIGTELSAMERLSISSFLRNGHEYHLYVYNNVENIPEGTVVKDGNEILPASMIFQYSHRKSYAGFANFFRYKLLLEKGGWWADTDIICLKPFAFDEEYIFASELWQDEAMITSGLIRVPANSKIMSYAWQICQTKDVEKLAWGETGPRLLAEAVRKFSLEKYRHPPNTFFPIPYQKWRDVLEPNKVWELGKETYAIHLWNEMWRQKDQDKNQRYHPDCLYEKLRNKYHC